MCSYANHSLLVSLTVTADFSGFGSGLPSLDDSYLRSTVVSAAAVTFDNRVLGEHANHEAVLDVNTVGNVQIGMPNISVERKIIFINFRNISCFVWC